LPSVRIISDSRAAVEQAVQTYATALHRRPEVCRVIWFGSRITGRSTPGSDVDLCIVLSGSDKTVRDRIPEYLPGAFPVGLDLFPYTEEELASLKQSSPGWYEAIQRGRET
jgi:predicted nucleotidyltransferase